MTIINLTPHEIVFIDDKGNRLVVQTSGKMARVSSRTVQVGSVDYCTGLDGDR